MFRVFGIHRSLVSCKPSTRLLRHVKTAATEETTANTLPAKPFRSIPGPKAYPLVGSIAYFASKKNREEDPINVLPKIYGPIVRLELLNRKMVIISDVDLVEQVHRSEGKFPSRSSTLEKDIKWIHEKNNLADRLVFAHQEEWKRLRTAMSKQVTPRRLSHFTPDLCSIADELCDHMTTVQEGSGQVDDVYQHAQHWALKGASKIVFNENIDVFSGKNPQANEFVQAAVEFIESALIIAQAPPIYKLIPTKPYKLYVERVKRLYNLGEQLLHSHYNDIVNDIEKGTVDETVAVGLLDQWLIEGKLSEKEAISQACVMLGAGVDTTGATGTFMLHEVAKNPQLQDALYQEVMEVVGPTSPPTAEQLQKLQLVRNCVKETLRLYPAASANVRTFLEDSILQGYKIPAGVTFIIPYYVIGRDEKYFPNPRQFDPSRWSTAKIHPFASLPFGFGPRMCYGRRISELELHILLTRIVQRFRLSTDQMVLKTKQGTVLRPDEAVTIQMQNLQA